MRKILLLGAGYGNLALLKGLPNHIFKQASFTLISKTDYHYIATRLHDIASGAKSEEMRIKLTEILPAQVEFIKDEVIEITKDSCITKNNSFSYDILVVGLGFSSESFGIKGVEEHTTPLVDYDNCINLSKQIKSLMLDYKNNRTKTLDIIICGGGFSGIEMIASLATNLPKMCEEFDIDSKVLNLTCIEAMPQILPMFNKNTAAKAQDYLQSLGIKFAIGAKILECQSNGVIIQKDGKEDKIPANLIIWTAGVSGNRVIEKSSFFTSVRSKVEVDNYLNIKDSNNIFVIGDCSALKDSNNRFYPPTAQIALQQGAYLARVFPSILENGKAESTFSFKSRGTLCSLGDKYAVGSIGTREFCSKMLIYIKYAIELMWRFRIAGFKRLFK